MVPAGRAGGFPLALADESGPGAFARPATRLISKNESPVYSQFVVLFKGKPQSVGGMCRTLPYSLGLGLSRCRPGGNLVDIFVSHLGSKSVGSRWSSAGSSRDAKQLR
jgi:hypothetical protein